MTMAVGEFCGKRVLVAGLGRSGIAASRALARAGARLAVYDDRDIEREAPEFFEELKNFGAECYLNGSSVTAEALDFVVMSPGISPALPFAASAKAAGAEIIGELELSYRLGGGRYLAVTGTNGKTTTTTLIGGIFAAAGMDAVVAGNIGKAVVAEAIEADDDTWLVTEVSSFQLETTERFRPDIAVFLNLTPDHMDRHGTMEHYSAAKAKVFANQRPDDFLVYNADDALVCALAETARAQAIPFSRTRALERGVFARDGGIFSAYGGGEPVFVAAVSELKIPGAHNLENALAATAAAVCAGITPGVIAETLRHFEGVEHRLEFVLEVSGVRFVNDSKGTNPDAAIKAIEAIGKDILLIAGGYDKNTDFSEYILASRGRVKKLLILGATAGKIKDSALRGGFAAADVIEVKDMAGAVRIGYSLAQAGDTVLLSPACASWDMYRDYEERGEHFKTLAGALRELS